MRAGVGIGHGSRMNIEVGIEVGAGMDGVAYSRINNRCDAIERLFDEGLGLCINLTTSLLIARMIHTIAPVIIISTTTAPTISDTTALPPAHGIPPHQLIQPILDLGDFLIEHIATVLHLTCCLHLSCLCF